MPPRSKVSALPYTLDGVSRACKISRVFEDDRQALSLAEIVARSGLERTVCFRLLRTLTDQGLLRRSDKTKYASNVRILSGKRFRIGYASQTSDSFCTALAQGLRWAAASRPIDLVEVDTLRSPPQSHSFLKSTERIFFFSLSIFSTNGLHRQPFTCRCKYLPARMSTIFTRSMLCRGRRRVTDDPDLD